jgi:hypothetical protein
MIQDKVFLKDLLNIILNYKKRAALIVLFTFAFCIQLTWWMNKSYRSSFEINVYSKYFQNPLISEIIPGVYNIPEMRFTIDSMVKEAISDEFIDELGTEFKLYSKTDDEITAAKQRQYFREQFGYFSTGGQSYKITYVNSDPFVAKKIAERTLEQVRNHFINGRIKTIELVRTIMIRKLNSFNASQKISQRGSENALASKSPDVLASELKKIETSIDALAKQYNKNHPKIINLNEQRKTILSWLEEFKKNGNLFSDTLDTPITVTTDKMISNQLSSKFYAKYHDFNIALDIEKNSLESYIGIIEKPQLPTSPISPKIRIFASVGLILGLIFAFIYIFVSEILLPNKFEQMELEAKLHNSYFLGTLTKKNKFSKDKTISLDTFKNLDS